MYGNFANAAYVNEFFLGPTDRGGCSQEKFSPSLRDGSGCVYVLFFFAHVINKIIRFLYVKTLLSWSSSKLSQVLSSSSRLLFDVELVASVQLSRATDHLK